MITRFHQKFQYNIAQERIRADPNHLICMTFELVLRFINQLVQEQIVRDNFFNHSGNSENIWYIVTAYILYEGIIFIKEFTFQIAKKHFEVLPLRLYTDSS